MFHFTSKRLESRKQKKSMWFQRRFEVASSRCIKNWCLDAVKASLTLKSEELIMKIVGSIQGTILSSNAHNFKRTIVYSDVTNSHVYLPGWIAICSYSMGYINGLLQDCNNPTWWRHQMETFCALLAICAGNSPVTCEFPYITKASGAELWCFLWSTSE